MAGIGTSHSVKCADAVRTTPSECRCACLGDFHGGPHSERVRALVWDESSRLNYSKRQVSAAKSKARQAFAAQNSIGEACTDFAVTHMIDELILVGEASEQQLTREMLKAVLAPFVAEIVKADLDDSDSKNIETAVNNLHVMCTLCVEILRLIQEVEDHAEVVAADIAQVVVASLGKPAFLTYAVRKVLKIALTRSFEAAMALAADPLKVKMIRVIGFVNCPNLLVHPEVEIYCVRPLLHDCVTAELYNWIDQSFPEDSDILKRAPRRKAHSEDQRR